MVEPEESHKIIRVEPNVLLIDQVDVETFHSASQSFAGGAAGIFTEYLF